MKNKLAVTVLGHRDSGKSSTWNELFGGTVKTGTNIRRLELRPGEFVDVFLVSGSAEERNIFIGDLLQGQTPTIVLCSTQYREDVQRTFNFLLEHEYQLYCQWLNPGYRESNDAGFDHLGMSSWLLGKEAILSMRNGKLPVRNRVQEIREYIYGWANYRNLIYT